MNEAYNPEKPERSPSSTATCFSKMNDKEIEIARKESRRIRDKGASYRTEEETKFVELIWLGVLLRQSEIVFLQTYLKNVLGYVKPVPRRSLSRRWCSKVINPTFNDLEIGLHVASGPSITSCTI